jgi:hypothetical protein
MSPLQGLSNEHSLFEDDEVAPGARAEVVVASGGVYIEFNLYFATSVTIGELELGLSTRAP